MPEKGLELFVHLIPDTGDLDKLEGKTINAKVNMKPGGMDPGAVGGGGGGIGMGGVAGGVVAGMGIFKVFEKILGVLTSLEPIQMILEMIGTLLKLFLMPLAIMLMTMLQPVLIMLFRLLPKWYNWLGGMTVKKEEATEEIKEETGVPSPLADILGWDVTAFLYLLWKFLNRMKETFGFLEGLAVGWLMSIVTFPLKLARALGGAWSIITSWDIPGKISGFFSGVGGFFGGIWADVTALEIPTKIKNWFEGIPGFFGGIWADVTALEIPTKIKNWFEGIPGFFGGIWADVTALEIPTKIKNWFEGIPGFFGGIWADVTALEIPTKIKNWFLGLPKFFTDLGTDIKELSIWDDIESAFGEFGDVIMDALAGVVKALYDAINKIPFIGELGIFEYPEWVKKQLKLGKYKEDEVTLYVGPQNSPLGPTYYGPDSGNYLPPGDVMGPVYPTVTINVEGLTSEEVLSLIASREWSELQRLTGGG